MDFGALSGVWAPALTPFRHDLVIDTPRFISHCRRLLRDGCHGLAVFGTTSEANSLSVEEKLEVLATLIEAGIPPAALMPGTGNCAIPDTVRLTKRAVELGCGGVLMLPPFYFKAVTDEGLFRAYAETIERVGDARLRVYLYHIPPIAQIGLSVALIDRLRRAYPGIVVGIKDSSGDWDNTRALLEAFPGFGILTGSEGFLLATLRTGGRGCISASANINAKAIRGLYDAWQNPEADRLQELVNALRLVLKPHPLMAALKLILSRMIDDPEWNRLRPPLVEMPAAAGATLLGDLQRIGFPIKGLPFFSPMLQ